MVMDGHLIGEGRLPVDRLDEDGVLVRFGKTGVCVVSFLLGSYPKKGVYINKQIQFSCRLSWPFALLQLL